MKKYQKDGDGTEHSLEVKKQKYNKMYLDIASRVAEMSYCKRKQVGAVLEKDGRIISMGWNGTRAGEDNCCEDPNNTTLPNVVHAEENCLKKLTTSTESSEDGVMYLTCAPCVRCSEKMVDAKIKKVYYTELYNSAIGIGLDYLEKHGIETEQLK